MKCLRKQLAREEAERIWPWDGTQEDWIVEYMLHDRYKILHLLGYGSEFEQLCNMVEGFDLLLTGKLMPIFQQKKR